MSLSDGLDKLAEDIEKFRRDVASKLDDVVVTALATTVACSGKIHPPAIADVGEGMVSVTYDGPDGSSTRWIGPKARWAAYLAMSNGADVNAGD
jgi:hypothetical protein